MTLPPFTSIGRDIGCLWLFVSADSIKSTVPNEVAMMRDFYASCVTDHCSFVRNMNDDESLFW